MNVSAGKLWGMRRLADDNGRYKMLAIDQRALLTNPMAEKLGVAEAPFDAVADVKAIFTRTLAPGYSAILLDPIYAYPYSVMEMPPSRGLVVTAEHAVVEETPGGKKSRIIPGWSIDKIQRLGADAVKLLVWYRPDASDDVLSHQQDLVERVGRECARRDMVFMLELLTYPMAGESADDPAYRAARADQVLKSVADFADPRFQVDIYKLQTPHGGPGVPEAGTAEGDKLVRDFAELDRLCPQPWVLLSAGVDAPSFARQLAFAYDAGASGYLAGRAIWQHAFRHFPDTGAMAQELETDGLAFMNEINALTDRKALVWSKHRAFPGGIAVGHAGPDFVEAYEETGAA